MLEQFKLLNKFRIQFTSKDQFGYVNVYCFGGKNEATNIFLKHCRLVNPRVIDCKYISSQRIDGGSAEVGTLTLTVNGQEVGTYSGENEIIDLSVPQKTSQLENDSSYITEDDISEDFAEEIKREVEESLAGKIENPENKVVVIDEHSTDVQYPSAKAVYDYVEKSVMTEEEVEEIIEKYSHD